MLERTPAGSVALLLGLALMPCCAPDASSSRGPKYATVAAKPAQFEASTASGEHEGAARLSDEHTQLAKELERIETRCWLEGDAEPYLELLAPDAKLVAARGATAGPYDVSFSLTAFQALQRNQCAQPVQAAFDVGDPALTFELQRVHKTPEGIVLDQVRAYRGFSTSERVHERFVFTLGKKGVEIRSLWYYPVSADSLAGLEFDTAQLPALDAKVEQSAAPIDRAYALFSALRYIEASDLYCQLANAPDADAESWRICGQSSLFAAQPERARAAFQAARALDPLIVLKP